MSIGHTPIRERLVMPRREGAPLSAVLTAPAALPEDTEAYLYFYDGNDEELAFWPLEVDGADITIDVQDWWTYRTDAKSFTVFVVYADAPSKYWPWFEGRIVRTY